MKTNKIMTRKMGIYNVLQRTKDGLFNASSLLFAWNKTTGSRKKIHEFLRIQSTKDFIEVLMQDIHQTQSTDNQVRDYNPQPDNQIVKVLGIINKTNVKTDSHGKKIPGEVWSHPYLFLDFVMWLNPKFKLQVIKFVYDQLIEFRHDAGDYYRGLTSAVTVYEGVDFSRIAKGLNYIVFAKHEPNLRQKATIQQLKSLSALQEKLAFAVNMGYIKSFEELINEMRRIYRIRDKYLAL